MIKKLTQPLFITLVTLGLTIASSASAATLILSPSSGTVSAGGTITVDIMLDTQGAAVDGVDVYSLHYNSSVLEVQDVNSSMSGVQITPGTLLPITLTNSVSNGLIQFSQVASGGTNYNGSGKLATITFKGIFNGTSPLTFDFTSGSTSDSNVAGGGLDKLTSVNTGSITVTGGTTNPYPTPTTVYPTPYPTPTTVYPTPTTVYVTPSVTTPLAIGASVVANSIVNVRSAPGTDAAIVSKTSLGTGGTVIDGPQTAGGYTWYKVQYSSGVTGWTADIGLSAPGTVTTYPYPTPSSGGGFSIGAGVVTNGNVNVRSAPGTDAAIIGKNPTLVSGTIVAGPQSASGYTWYQVRYSNSILGWTASIGLSLPGGSTGTLTPKLKLGYRIVTTANVNVRSTASVTGVIIDKRLMGKKGLIIGGPTISGGYVWWKIRYDSGPTGYSVENYLAKE